MLGDAGSDVNRGGEGHDAACAVLSSGIICQGLPFLIHDYVFVGIACSSLLLSPVLPISLEFSTSCSSMIMAVIY